MTFAAATTAILPQKRSIHWWTFIDVPNRKSRAFAAVALVALSFLYIIQTNAVATRGYEITTLSKQLKEVQGVNKALELQIAELRTTKALEQRVQELNLVKVHRVDYISPTASAVAVAR